MTDSGKLAVLDHVHSKGSVSASWPGAEGATESGGSDWDIDDQFGYGASRSDSQIGTSNSDYLSLFPDVRSVVYYFAQTTGVFHRGDIALPASELLLVNIPGGTVVYATTHRYDWESLYWNNGVPQSTNTTHVYAIMKWGDGDAWYTDLRAQVAQFAPITRLPDTPTPLPIDWQGMARDAAIISLFPGYGLYLAYNALNSYLNPSDADYKANYFDTYLNEENGRNDDLWNGRIDGFLDGINPINNLVSFPDIGMNYGHQDAYDSGKFQGEIAGTVAQIAVTGFGSGVFSCGTLGNKAMAAFEIVSIANDLKGAHDCYQKGDAAGAALNLLSAVGNIASLRNTLNSCFAKGTKLWWEHGYKPIEDFLAGERVWSRDENDPNGQLSLKAIDTVFVRLGAVYQLLIGGQTIRTTDEHPFYRKSDGWTPTNQLQVGDLLLSADGQWLPVEAVFDTGDIETVYNLRVAEFHTYFVGSAEWNFRLWAHNAAYGNANFGKILKDNNIFAPDGMLDPHAHHILFKTGNGAAQRALVKEGQDILRKMKIDPIFGIENLVWAPNRIKGQHGIEPLRNVVNKLKELDAAGGDYDDFVKLLKELGQLAADRR